MTPDPYQRLLAKMAADAEPEFLDPHTDRSDWWRERAKSYARVADEMLREWRKMYPLAHPRKHDGPMGD